MLETCFLEVAIFFFRRKACSESTYKLKFIQISIQLFLKVIQEKTTLHRTEKSIGWQT